MNPDTKTFHFVFAPANGITGIRGEEQFSIRAHLCLIRENLWSFFLTRMAANGRKFSRIGTGTTYTLFRHLPSAD